MNWAIAAHISPKNGRIHNSKFPSAGNVHGNKNYAFPQGKSCLHIADFHQPTVLGAKSLAALERADCRALIAACREKGLSPKSLENICRTLSSVLTQAV